MANVYSSGVKVSVFAEDKDTFASSARTLVTNPSLYIPTVGNSGLADSGRQVLQVVCEDYSPPPSDISIECSGEMKADVILVVDLATYSSENYPAVTDLVLNLDKALEAEGDDVRLALVVHTDNEKPIVHIPTVAETIEDVLTRRRRSVVDDDVSEVAAIEPTLDYLNQEPVLPRSYESRSKVVVTVTGRKIKPTEDLKFVTTIMGRENVTNILISSDKDSLQEITSASNLLHSFEIVADLSPRKLVNKTNEVLDLICQAPERPLIDDVCEAEVETVILLDGEVASDSERQNDVERFFEIFQRRVGFGSKTPSVYLTNFDGINIDSGFVKKRLNESSEEFPQMEGLTRAIEEFEGQEVKARKVILTISKRQSDVTNLDNIIEDLNRLNVTLIALVVESQYFLPEVADRLDYKEISVSTDTALTNAIPDILTIECNPPPPSPPVLKHDACLEGEVIFLYDVALFSPPRDGRVVKTFLKDIMRLMSAYTDHFATTVFKGFGFGGDSVEEFSAFSNDSIAMAKLRIFIDNLQHDSVKSNPPFPGKALRHVNSQFSQQGNHLVILLLGRESFDDLPAAVKEAKLTNTEVVTFYIGGLTFPDVDEISTKKSGSVKVERVDDLINLEYELLELICIPQPTPPPTIPPTTTTFSIPLVKPCKLDMVFVVDDSYRFNKKRVSFFNSFITQFAGYVPFDGDQTQIGFIYFGKKAKTLYPGFISNKAKLLRSVRKRFRPKSPTGPISYIRAFNKAVGLIESSTRKDSDVKRLIVFISTRNGKTVLPPSKLQEALGNNIFVGSITAGVASSISENSLTNYDLNIDAKK